MDIQWIHFLINNQSYTIFLISIQLKEPVTPRVDREPATRSECTEQTTVCVCSRL